MRSKYKYKFFSAVENIESYLQINTQKTVEKLSAQQIVSCTPNVLQCGGKGIYKFSRKKIWRNIVINKDLSGGCQGSIPELGFTYTQLFGLVSEADYPYVSNYVQLTNFFFEIPTLSSTWTDM